MPTNANTFNSRVTSEALEAKFRQVFPAQGGAELVQDLFASGVIQPVVDFSTVAEGSVLAQNLQTAWDISTGHSDEQNSSSTIISNTGFWRLQGTAVLNTSIAGSNEANIQITDGLTTKMIWVFEESNTGNSLFVAESFDFVVFLKSGESAVAQSTSSGVNLNISWRQIADVNGNLVNPLGFTFS